MDDLTYFYCTRCECSHDAARGPIPVECLREFEIVEELRRLNAQFSDADFDALETNLVLRAYILGWTGDPLKQPPETVLAAARQVLEERDR